MVAIEGWLKMLLGKLSLDLKDRMVVEPGLRMVRYSWICEGRWERGSSARMSSTTTELLFSGDSREDSFSSIHSSFPPICIAPIQDMNDIPYNEQILLYSRYILEDSRTLESYGIQDGNKVQLSKLPISLSNIRSLKITLPACLR